MTTNRWCVYVRYESRQAPLAGVDREIDRVVERIFGGELTDTGVCLGSPPDRERWYDVRSRARGREATRRLRGGILGRRLRPDLRLHAAVLDLSRARP